jgi:hypothetical protein
MASRVRNVIVRPNSCCGGKPRATWIMLCRETPGMLDATLGHGARDEKC